MTIIASIHGRAGFDGELRESAAGKPWSRLNVACMAGSDRETKEAHTQWVTVVAFGRQAEELATVAKGETVSAMGRIELNRWQGQDGEQREGWQLIADAVMAVKSARPKGGKAAQPQGTAPGQQAPRQGQVDFQAPPKDEPFDDDIPF